MLCYWHHTMRYSVIISLMHIDLIVCVFFGRGVSNTPPPLNVTMPSRVLQYKIMASLCDSETLKVNVKYNADYGTQQAVNLFEVYLPAIPTGLRLATIFASLGIRSR